jgi:hypothetical protein
MPKHRAYTISGVNAGQVQEYHDRGCGQVCSRIGNCNRVIAVVQRVRGGSIPRLPARMRLEVIPEPVQLGACLCCCAKCTLMAAAAAAAAAVLPVSGCSMLLSRCASGKPSNAILRVLGSLHRPGGLLCFEAMNCILTCMVATVHYVVAWGFGGRAHLHSNMQVACTSCRQLQSRGCTTLRVRSVCVQCTCMHCGRCLPSATSVHQSLWGASHRALS